MKTWLLQFMAKSFSKIFKPLSLNIPANLQWNTDANEKVECNAKFNPDSAI